MRYIAYLDEFGHQGRFDSRQSVKYNESPVFGLAGYILPISQVRVFSSWVYNRKSEMFKFKIQKSRICNSRWEIKGSRLFTVDNVTNCPSVKNFGFRLFNKIYKSGGFVFYVGERKTDGQSAQSLYTGALREAIKRINQFCENEGSDEFPSRCFLALDENYFMREKFIYWYSQNHNTTFPENHLIEPPFQLESNHYQTIQAADWVASLVGRLGAYWKCPDEFADFKIFNDYYEQKLEDVSIRSSIRS